MQVDLTAVRMIPRELAEKQNLLAVGFADKSLEVVTNDPLNYFAFEEAASADRAVQWVRSVRLR